MAVLHTEVHLRLPLLGALSVVSREIPRYDPVRSGTEFFGKLRDELRDIKMI
jgi:hypothetical protein